MAGRDTVRASIQWINWSWVCSEKPRQTAGLTTFVVTMLAEHPEVLARLRKEVLDTLGPTGKVSPDNLKEMKYLRAVLNGSSILPSRRPALLTLHRDAEAVSERVRINIPPNSHNQTEYGLVVHGTSGVPRKAPSGQLLMEESRYTSRVAPRFTICLG